MKQLFSVLLVLLSHAVAWGQWCPGGSCAEPQQYQSQQYRVQQQRILPRDPRVVYLSDGGSGCFVEICGQSYILTCAHKDHKDNKFMPGDRVNYVCSDGKAGLAAVVDLDAYSDCAVLSANVSPGKAFTIATEPIQPGQPAKIVGFPASEGTQRYNVRPTTCDEVEASGMVIMFGSGIPGESGGPLINDRSQIVGVMFASEVGRPRSFCCGLPAIRTLIDRVRTRVCPSQQPPQPAPTANNGANVLILASLAKIEQRLTVIENKQGEPGPAGPQGERGAAGPAGSNADLSFKIRVRNPRTGYTTPFAEVKNHGEVTLILDPAQLGEK